MNRRRIHYHLYRYLPMTGDRSNPVGQTPFEWEYETPAGQLPYEPEDEAPVERRPYEREEEAPVDRRPYEREEEAPVERRPYKWEDRTPVERRPYKWEDRTPVERRPYEWEDKDKTPVCPGGILYSIKAGDTFYKIAKTYGIDMYAVMKANPNVNPNNLQIGQQICVPGVETSRCPGGFIYTIQPGDTFYKLAKTYGIDMYSIMKANPNVDPNRLQIGQPVCIPAVGNP